MDAVSESDWESLSESGSSEEHEEMHFLLDGQAQSILSSLEESIGKIDDFLSFERSFLYGDIVCSVTDPAGQMGRVINIDVIVDLENVHGKKIKNVNSKKLFKIRSISVGDYVVHESWIGRVNKVVDLVSIVFDDGSKCEFNVLDQEKLVPLSPNLLEDPQYPYYPGQRVRVMLSNGSKSARWLCGTWRGNPDEGTVSAVDAGVVYVDWIASARPVSDLAVSRPSNLQESRNLTLLSCLSHASWQLGDWCTFPVADFKGNMGQIFLDASMHDLINGHVKLESGFKRGNLGSRLEEIFVIVKTRTKVDIAWQDGSCSLGLDSQDLLPISTVNHEFVPEQIVLEKGTCDNSKKWGVVRGMDAKERTVKVQWRNMSINEANGFNGERIEETVSAYELVEHPDYNYYFGDIVVKVVQKEFGDQANRADLISESALGTEAASKGNNCGWDQNRHPGTCYLSCIGIVTGFEDGDVEVKWATGFSTKVSPYEIYRIDKFEGSDPTPLLHEEASEEINQEMIRHEKQSPSLKGKELVNSEGVGENSKNQSWAVASFFLPRVAVGFFTSIASGILGSLGSTTLLNPYSSGHVSGDGKEYGILLQEEALETCDIRAEPDSLELQTFETAILKQEAEENEQHKSIMFLGAGENPDKFGQFDMVNDCSDHHFLGESKALAMSQVKCSWLKKVQQEWSILEKNLPETIYVRIYEERMDLLRAALVGAPATPYHDGLFFFDIFLPPEYPHEPPVVYYNSGGLRLNPNLYESGKVCLSLLNTWAGSGTEVWNPGKSTVLQVLLSLQALVLNEKPYFNEAGYDKQVGRAEGEKNSVSYNENAFLVTCKSMLYILRKPPKHFEALVREHFSRRSESILLACKAYMEGAPLGFASEYKENGHEDLKGSSTGFKIMLAKLFPKLVEAFSDEGIDCSQFTAPEK